MTDRGVVDASNPVHVHETSGIELGFEGLDVGHFFLERPASTPEVVPVLFEGRHIVSVVPCGGGQAGVVAVDHKTEATEERMVGRRQTFGGVEGHWRFAPDGRRCSCREVVAARRGHGSRVVGPAQARHAVASEFIACLDALNRHAGFQPTVLFPCLGRRQRSRGGQHEHGEQQEGQHALHALLYGAHDLSLAAQSRRTMTCSGEG